MVRMPVTGGWFSLGDKVNAVETSSFETLDGQAGAVFPGVPMPDDLALTIQFFDDQGVTGIAHDKSALDFDLFVVQAPEP